MKAFDLDQVALADTWAVFPLGSPRSSRSGDAGPVRIGPALHGLDGMDAAAGSRQEVATLVGAKPEHVAGAANIALFEGLGCHPEMSSHFDQVRFSEIDVAGAITTANATGLAGKAQVFGRAWHAAVWRYCPATTGRPADIFVTRRQSG
jgi:hypothetical protein